MKAKANSNVISIVSSNGVVATFLVDFEKINIFYEGKFIESFSSRHITVNELAKKLDAYV